MWSVVYFVLWGKNKGQKMKTLAEALAEALYEIDKKRKKNAKKENKGTVAI